MSWLRTTSSSRASTRSRSSADASRKRFEDPVRAELSGGWFGVAFAAALLLGVAGLALLPRERTAVRNTLLVLGAAALVAVGAAATRPAEGAHVAGEIAVLVVGLVLVRP